MDAVQDGQQDLGQAQQVIEVVEAKVDQIPGQIHHLHAVDMRVCEVSVCGRVCGQSEYVHAECCGLKYACMRLVN